MSIPEIADSYIPEAPQKEQPPFAPERIKAKVHEIFGTDPQLLAFDEKGRAQNGVIQITKSTGGANVIETKPENAALVEQYPALALVLEGNWTYVEDSVYLRATVNGIVVAEYDEFPSQGTVFYRLHGADYVGDPISAQYSESIINNEPHTEVTVKSYSSLGTLTYRSVNGVEDTTKESSMSAQNQEHIAWELGLV